jgi:hypothetical protein
MKVNIICEPNHLAEALGITPLPYRDALERAFQVIEQDAVISSWKDAINNPALSRKLSDLIEVPSHGCFKDAQRYPVHDGAEAAIQRIWAIGGETGWYYGNWLWQIRGFVDKLSGGVGLRRGRTHPDQIHNGDSLDFWRVLYAGKEEMRLLLYAEMKIPGDAWLEFRIEGDATSPVLVQTATFRPRGLMARLYWFALLPFHYFIFKGMGRQLAGKKKK